jgi:murein DD-endopeptidase MepM/ murein hydrolase activator NlpD
LREREREAEKRRTPRNHAPAASPVSSAAAPVSSASTVSSAAKSASVKSDSVRSAVGKPATNASVVAPAVSVSAVASAAHKTSHAAPKASASAGHPVFVPAAPEAPAWIADAPALASVSVAPSAKAAKARRSAASARVRKVSAAKTAPTSSVRSRAASRMMSAAALLFAGAMVVGLSVPASAFLVDTSTAPMAADAPRQTEGQVLAADSSVSVEAIEYDSWGVASRAELQQASSMRLDSSYTVTNEGAIRWPFPFAVPISDGYGARTSPCSGCSSQHKGTDFTPGVGTAIGAIADGVVSQKNNSSWGFGYHIYIDHVINGQKVTSVYAHMQTGSSELEVGDVVAAGDFVGLVGTTGASTGPHLHLEVRVDGVQVDPFAWLAANAG